MFLKFSILLSILVFGVSENELNASQKSIFTCVSQDPGIPGKKGDQGPKGDKGICPTDCKVSTDRIARLETELEALKKDVHRCVSDRCGDNKDSLSRRTMLFSGSSPKNCYKYELSNCLGLYYGGNTTSGIYNITVSGRAEKSEVYCDQETDGGGWLVFQRRMDGSVDFYRNWNEYVHGFGNLNGEFWLGLDLLHAITSSNSYQLRVDIEDWDGNTAYAIYRNFSVGNSQSNYRLNVQDYNGTAGNALSPHNNQQFTTKDRDNDGWPDNCADRFHGAFWYNSCYNANLNGKYIRNGDDSKLGVVWYAWKDNFYSLKRVEMKIKPNKCPCSNN